MIRISSKNTYGKWPLIVVLTEWEVRMGGQSPRSFNLVAADLKIDFRYFWLLLFLTGKTGVTRISERTLTGLSRWRLRCTTSRQNWGLFEPGKLWPFIC